MSSATYWVIRAGNGGLIPIARPKFVNCPPPAGSPRFARGTAHGFGSPARRGNLKEGVINCCFFVNFGLAIGITPRASGSGRVQFPQCDGA